MVQTKNAVWFAKRLIVQLVLAVCKKILMLPLFQDKYFRTAHSNFQILSLRKKLHSLVLV